MDAIGFFLARHTSIHAGWTDALLEGLKEEQLRHRAHPNVNSIAWLLWHAARAEDIGVSVFVGRRPQLMDEQEWLPRLNVLARDLGVGMTDAEADELSASIDLDMLRAYWDAVGKRTRDIVKRATPSDLDEINDAAFVRHAVQEQDLLRPNAAWGIDHWAGRRRGSILGYLGLAHSYEHFGGAMVLRGLMGFRGR